MGLSEWLATAAVRRSSVLAVEMPGWARTRWALEQDVRRRGWRLALSPADADLLVTCGRPGSRMLEALDLAWAQLPGPRVRTELLDPAAVAGVLDDAAAQLHDQDRQRQDAADRPADPAMGTAAEQTRSSGDDGRHDDQGKHQHDGAAEGHGAMHMDGSGGMGGMDMGGMDMGGMDMGGMDMGGMDMGGMDMEPGGIPLASGEGGDRDGLDLDVLHVALGPVLPCWPAGLVLHCTLHGDVVSEARPQLLSTADAVPEAGTRRTPSDRLDRAAQVLTLAGWDDAATQAARLRDDLLDAADPQTHAASVDRLIRRVSRSRTLRWSLRGLGRIDPVLGRARQLDERLSGDVWDRLLGLLEAARPGLTGQRLPGSGSPVATLPDLVAGLELSAARLVVASLDLDTTAQHQPRAVPS